MSYSVGDGMVTLSLAAGIVGYLYVRYLGQQKKLEIIHQERMAAMEKGIPLPEFPLEPEQARRPEPPIILILGIFLLTLSLGTMVVLFAVLPADSHIFWITPLPFTFLGGGLITFHFLKANPWR